MRNEITRIGAKNGRRSVVFVSMAITPIVMPSDIEPVSPMKNFAG